MSPIETTEVAPEAAVFATEPPTRTRADISRENALHSTGPRTPAGKRRASQNATKHGLYATSNLIRGESAEAFERLSTAFFNDLDPKGATECELVNDLADAAWRKRRFRRIEAEVFEESFERRDVQADAGEDVDGVIGGPAARQLADAQRFAARAHREFRHALRDLSSLRRDRDRSAALAANRAWKGHEGVTDSWARRCPLTENAASRDYIAIHPTNYFDKPEGDAGDECADDVSSQIDETKPVELATTRVEIDHDAPDSGYNVARAV